MGTSLPKSGLVGLLFFHPGALPEIVIVDLEASVIDSRVVSPEAQAPGAWDRGLINLGYHRVSEWWPAEGCEVEPL
jgi:hypothetical protein